MKKNIKKEEPKIEKIHGVLYVIGNGVKIDLKTFLKFADEIMKEEEEAKKEREEQINS